jgi:hypothetical protein
MADMKTKTLNCLIANISQIKYAFNFFMISVLICYYHFHIFEPFHIFKSFISCIYIMMMFCSLVMKHEGLLNFLYAYL